MDNTAIKPGKSRYEHVKDILNAAAAGSTADYQGYGNFWDLPYEEFLNFKLYGIRMIAPSPDAPPSPDEPGGITPWPGNYGPGGQDAPFCYQDPDTAPQEGRSAAPSAGVSSTPDPALSSPPPATTGSCCGGGGADPGRPAVPEDTPPTGGHGHSNHRSATSGLIMGLKGQAPFDGCRYPRLPWGGKEVPATQIQYIADWIDDGCPRSDAEEKGNGHEDAQAKTRRINLAFGKESYESSAKMTNHVRQSVKGPSQRKNIECLSQEELCQFRYAVWEMMKLNKWPQDNRNWNSYGRLHGDECQHGWEAFLPWHRMFLYEFEQALQDIAPGTSIPYWDWTMKAYQDGQPKTATSVPVPDGVATIPQAYVGGIIPTYLRCFLTRQGAENLKAQGVPGDIDRIVGFAYDSGSEFFWVVGELIGVDNANGYYKIIQDELMKCNPLWHPNRWPAQFPASFHGLDQFNHHYPTSEEVSQILQLNNWRDFGGGTQYDRSFGMLDMNPHNTGHIWSGGFNPFYQNDKYKYNSGVQMGDMLNNLTAGYDPIFWPHHSNVDRVYHKWQLRNPGKLPVEQDMTLSGLGYRFRDANSIEPLGYEYVDDSCHYETNKDVGSAILRTGGVSVHSLAMKRYEKVVLRLHQVAQPQYSHTVRIFLNQDDANSQTPFRENDRYVGKFSLFGHGKCIGGPGHCDPRDRNVRPNDFRPKHHNDPWNYKFDITDAVNKAKARGEKDVKISLVTVGEDIHGRTDLLKMEGLSINFHS